MPMIRLRHPFSLACAALVAALLTCPVASFMPVGIARADTTTTAAQRVTVTGEMIDTWCYYSGVMGGPEAVVGSAHHTCALWCAAGGIPVGLLTEDGEVFLVLKLENAGTADGADTVLAVQSNTLTADGMLYKRDGLNYLVVEKIVNNAGVTNRNHTDFGVVPPFALGEKTLKELAK
ncbi:MAG: hypothetical protein AAFQ42_01785 [Pseudomonadota bacterium]